ncbi:phosphotransferase [Streptomyces sp. NPDC005435]|uniref:phosphotransferase n=1 Tax=Streptomyces sp. NPDC005435 TaxID=3154464 RepID=UPI0034561E05
MTDGMPTARLGAFAVSRERAAVEGPLAGYHHETYVLPLPSRDRSSAERWKAREPRAGIKWFDRGCLHSEEPLLRVLAGRVTGLPGLLETNGVASRQFIEGSTLGRVAPAPAPVPEALFRQLVGFFGQLARIDPAALAVARRCVPADRPADGDGDGFLGQLIDFVEQHVYRTASDEFEQLFHSLGIGPGVFRSLRAHVSGLRGRPFRLLHGDLHRENLIVDADGRLWVIDWELAMVGDPLYDLATHLHLMRYPAWQAGRMAREWSRAVGPVSSDGWQEDLVRIMHFKRAQSVFTDVIRAARDLGTAPDTARVTGAASRLHRVLTAAAEPLGLAAVPAPRDMAEALDHWRPLARS